jgi:hypothetical protein
VGRAPLGGLLEVPEQDETLGVRRTLTFR